MDNNREDTSSLLESRNMSNLRPKGIFSSKAEIQTLKHLPLKVQFRSLATDDLIQRRQINLNSRIEPTSIDYENVNVGLSYAPSNFQMRNGGVTAYI